MACYVPGDLESAPDIQVITIVYFLSLRFYTPYTQGD